MNAYDLGGRTAVVTGGAQGIGLAVAQRLKASGAAVAIWDRDEGLARDSAAAGVDRSAAIRRPSR